MSRTIYLAIGYPDWDPYKILHAYSTREAAQERIRPGIEWLNKWTDTRPSSDFSPEWKEWRKGRQADSPEEEEFCWFEVEEVEMD